MGMTRETKIGLLLGLGVILLIGIIISDQLSQVQQDPADFTGFAAESQRSIDASDATPTYAPGYAPAYAPAASPNRPPVDHNTVTDVPGDFFIPDDVQTTLPSLQQADATADRQIVPGNQPLPAYNVQDAVGQPPQVDQVPTLTLGNPTPQPPAFTQITGDRADAPAEQPRVIPASSDNSGIKHTVQAGESLMKIARRYYGDGEYWRAIALANPNQVSRDGSIQIGAVLNIPKRDDAVLGLDIAAVEQERTIPVDLRQAVGRSPSSTIEVQSGDTLSELASKHLGSAALWEDLLDANKDQLDSPEALRVGMKLKMPAGASPVQTGSVAQQTPTPTRTPSKTYTVKPGDNLTDIAQKTLGDGDKWRRVYEANRDKLKSPDRLIVGQELRIPG